MTDVSSAVNLAHTEPIIGVPCFSVDKLHNPLPFSCSLKDPSGSDPEAEKSGDVHRIGEFGPDDPEASDPIADITDVGDPFSCSGRAGFAEIDQDGRSGPWIPLVDGIPNLRG